MAKDLCVDLGTAMTRAYVPGRGLIADEPTLVALDTRAGKVLAVGDAAAPIVGRGDRFVLATYPVQRAAVSDFDATRRLLRVLLERAGAGRFAKPRVVVCVRAGCGPVEH